MDVNTYGAGSTPNDKYLLNAAYLRFKNLTFGYTVPVAIAENLGFQSLRVYLSGENLMEWSEVSDIIDPEAITDNGRGYAYPFQRRYSIGVNISF
jgi:hypothetical protein